LKAANSDHAEAEYHFGFCLEHEHGLGIEMNLIEAARYYHLSGGKRHARWHYSLSLRLCRDFSSSMTPVSFFGLLRIANVNFSSFILLIECCILTHEVM
jgi:hypothetical protein